MRRIKGRVISGPAYHDQEVKNAEKDIKTLLFTMANARF